MSWNTGFYAQNHTESQYIPLYPQDQHFCSLKVVFKFMSTVELKYMILYTKLLIKYRILILTYNWKTRSWFYTIYNIEYWFYTKLRIKYTIVELIIYKIYGRELIERVKFGRFAPLSRGGGWFSLENKSEHVPYLGGLFSPDDKIWKCPLSRGRVIYGGGFIKRPSVILAR